MEKTSTFIRILSVRQAPTYYNMIINYKFLYMKNGTYFIVKYHYYNQWASFSTLVVPRSSLNEIELYEKENEMLYVERASITDDYQSVLNKLSLEKRNKIEKEVKQDQSDENSIRLLLYAYELSGNSLI